MNPSHLNPAPCRHLLTRPRLPSTIRSTSYLDQSIQRSFSQSPALLDDEPERVRQKKAPTRLRRRMYLWLNGPGRAFRDPLRGSTNYLGAYTFDGRLRRVRNDRRGDAQDAEAAAEEAAEENDEDAEGEEDAGEGLPPAREPDLRPYPLNPNFHSQKVLSEEMRDVIWQKVVEKKESVSAVSAELGVDMRRIGAVVRLKTVEKNWEKEGTPFASAYASAVMAMLPQTKHNPKNQKPHESINDLPVHPATQQQIFYPTSESRQFTREDAARVFSPTLLPADKRIPHPELIEAERPEHADLKPQQRARIADQLRQAMEKEKQEAEQKRRRWEQKNIQVVQKPKWDFRFESIKADNVGRNGRHPAGVGWRYGMPHEDRKRGHMKDVPDKVLT
ncbi:37S ribosomal protein S35, mitochondrial [Elsinoe australis]|uniref:37S ribosomal protein S35, mitochondrial n=1 Tax=Elsinoe australis TaxID=40998 RepID=A0A2P8AK73_9PEZI|nr:37S ribosomal protein S35, mitochondrial [Elsinoe australis]